MIFVCPKCGTSSAQGSDGRWHWCCTCFSLERMNIEYGDDQRDDTLAAGNNV